MMLSIAIDEVAIGLERCSRVKNGRYDSSLGSRIRVIYANV